MPDPPGTQWLKSGGRFSPQNFNDNFASNLEAATKDLKLSPQEQNVYNHHLQNLRKGGVRNEGGISSFLNLTTEIGGRTYTIPSVWDNKILRPKEAIRRAVSEGIDRWPSYDSEEAAQKRYQDLHAYMERDTGSAYPER